MPLLIQELNGEVHPVGNNIVITNDSFAKLEKINSRSFCGETERMERYLERTKEKQSCYGKCRTSCHSHHCCSFGTS